MSREAGSGSAGKKQITIAIIIILVLGFGYFLFKISPATTNPSDPFDYSKMEAADRPSPVSSQDHVKGDVNAKNTFIVYEDFQCPACANFSTEVSKVTSVFKDTKVVFRHFPLTSIHKNALVGAMASEAAAAQGKFWEMHDQLYLNQDDWSTLGNPTEKFVEFAKAAGVADLNLFKSDLESKKYFERVQKDALEANALNLRGTPTVIFNDHVLTAGAVEAMEAEAKQWYIVN